MQYYNYKIMMIDYDERFIHITMKIESLRFCKINNLFYAFPNETVLYYRCSKTSSKDHFLRKIPCNKDYFLQKCIFGTCNTEIINFIIKVANFVLI